MCSACFTDTLSLSLHHSQLFIPATSFIIQERPEERGKLRRQAKKKKRRPTEKKVRAAAPALNLHKQCRPCISKIATSFCGIWLGNERLRSDCMEGEGCKCERSGSQSHCLRGLLVRNEQQEAFIRLLLSCSLSGL